jgi:hypothetical protein
LSLCPGRDASEGCQVPLCALNDHLKAGLDAGASVSRIAKASRVRNATSAAIDDVSEGSREHVSWVDTRATLGELSSSRNDYHVTQR